MEALVGMSVNEAVSQLKQSEIGMTFANFNAIEADGDTAVFYAGKNRVKEVSIYNKEFQKFLMKKENYPADYVHTLGQNLEQDIIHHHISKLDPFRLNPGNNLVICTSTDDLRIMSYLHKYVKPSEILQMHSEMIPGEEKTVAKFSNSRGGVSYSLLSDKWNVSFMDRGDVSFFGLSANWGDSFVAPKIFGSSHRPSCANLLYHHKNVGRMNMKFKNMSKLEVMNRFKGAAKKAIDYVNNHLIPNLNSTMSVTYPNGLEVLMQLVDKYSFTDNGRIAIRQALEAEPGDTLYHLIQACTRAETHSVHDANDRVLLKRLLKALMASVEQEEHVCIACGH